MSVSAALKDSMARSLDAVSSFLQYSAMIAGLLFLLSIVTFVFDGPKTKGQQDAAPIVAAISESVSEQSKPADTASGAPVAEAKPQVAGVLDYVKRRYRVSPDAVLPVFEVAQLIGKERRIDPLLILAIIGVESGFNPFAESTMGAQGLMQIIPRFHMDKVPAGAGNNPLFDPAINIRVGVSVLEEAIRRRGGLTAGLQSYAGSSDVEGGYASKVLAEKARLEKAARRSMESESSA